MRDIKKIRAGVSAHKISIRELGSAADLSTQTVHRALRGYGTTKPDTLEKLHAGVVKVEQFRRELAKQKAAEVEA